MSEAEMSAYNPEFFTHWERFCDGVARAFDPTRKPAKDERERHVTALLAVTALLRNASNRDADVNEIAARFYEMAEALQDQIDGVPHPLFRLGGTPKKGRPADPSGLWRMRALVCLAIEYVISAGVDDAIALVVRKHQKQLVRLQRPNTKLKAALAAWRKNFASEQVTNEIALRTYKEGIRQLDSDKQHLTDRELRSVGENLLLQAADRARLLPTI